MRPHCKLCTTGRLSSPVTFDVANVHLRLWSLVDSFVASSIACRITSLLFASDCAGMGGAHVKCVGKLVLQNKKSTQTSKVKNFK